MKGSITLLLELILLWGIFGQGTGLSLIKNENDIGIPNQKEAASDGFEKDGDESTFLASEFPGHTTDEDTQEPTSAADVTESHPTVLQEAEENGPSQGESPSDQLQDGEHTTENVPASQGTEENSSTVHQTEVVSPIQEEDSTVHVEADQDTTENVPASQGNVEDSSTVHQTEVVSPIQEEDSTVHDEVDQDNKSGYDIPDSGPDSSHIQQEDGGSPDPVVDASGQDEAGKDASEILHGSVEINEIPTRPQLDENESCRQDEGPIFHDLSYGFSGQDTQETKVTDMQYKVTSKSEKTEHPDSGMQHDADEQDVESASPASQRPFLSLLVLPLAVLII